MRRYKGVCFLSAGSVAGLTVNRLVNTARFIFNALVQVVVYEMTNVDGMRYLPACEVKGWEVRERYGELEVKWNSRRRMSMILCLKSSSDTPIK